MNNQYCRGKNQRWKVTALAIGLVGALSSIGVCRAEGNNPVAVGLFLAQNEAVSKSVLSEQRGAGASTDLPVLPRMSPQTGVIFWDELQPTQIHGLLNTMGPNQSTSP